MVVHALAALTAAFAAPAPMAAAVAPMQQAAPPAGAQPAAQEPDGEEGFFKTFDRDGDGAVTVAEVEAFKADVARADPAAGEEAARQLAQVFPMMDTDHDERITREEYRTTVAQLRKGG